MFKIIEAKLVESIRGDPYKVCDILLGQFTHTPNFFQFIDFWVGWMIKVKFLKNIVEYLLVKLLDAWCWFGSCSQGFFFELNLLGIDITNNPKCLEK